MICTDSTKAGENIDLINDNSNARTMAVTNESVFDQVGVKIEAGRKTELFWIIATVIVSAVIVLTSQKKKRRR